MYTTGTASAATFGSASLASTGFASFWFVVTGVAITTGGLMLRRLVPKKEF